MEFLTTFLIAFLTTLFVIIGILVLGFGAYMGLSIIGVSHIWSLVFGTIVSVSCILGLGFTIDKM